MNAIAEVFNRDIAQIKADVTLDVRGIPCPLPPLKTASALKKMRPGQILEVLGPNLVAKHSAPLLAKLMGNEILDVEENEDGTLRFYVKKK